MDKKIIEIFKLASKFEALGQVTGVEAADIQVALGQNEQAGTFRSAGGRDYYSQDKINAIITDFANKFNIADNTKGSVDINYNNGAISFVVNMTDADAKKAPAVAKYLRAQYSGDMARRVISYLKSRGKAPTGVITASWIKF